MHAPCGAGWHVPRGRILWASRMRWACILLAADSARRVRAACWSSCFEAYPPSLLPLLRVEKLSPGGTNWIGALPAQRGVHHARRIRATATRAPAKGAIVTLST